MAIDEKALAAAKDAYVLHCLDPIAEDTARLMLEAYEAARWRPIGEVEHLDTLPDKVLICRTRNLMPEISTAFAMDDAPTWCIADGSGDFGETEIRHSKLVEEGAMFRTIDPPQQDAVSRATSTPPAAESTKPFISVHDEISEPGDRRMDQETPRTKS